MSRLDLAGEIFGLIFEEHKYSILPLAVLLVLLARRPTASVKRHREESPLGPFVYPFA